MSTAERKLTMKTLNRRDFGVDFGLALAAAVTVRADIVEQILVKVNGEIFTKTDLEQRQNRHQPLSALSAMADEVLGAVAVRLEREGRLAPGSAPVRIIERPPLAGAA